MGNSRTWFRNSIHSLGSISKSIVKDIAPVTMTTVSAGRNAATNLPSARNHIIAMDKMTPVRSAKKIFDEALADIKSGNFGVPKANDDLFDAWENEISDDFDMTQWDDDAEHSSEEISMAGDRAIAKSVISASSAQLAGMEAMTNAIVGSTVKMSKASTEQSISAVVYVGNLVNRNLVGINQSLNTINENLTRMIDFQNENVSPTNQALLTYLEESSSMMQDFGKMLENLEQGQYGKVDYHETFNAKDGFDINDYFSFVKRNFETNGTIGLGKMIIPALLSGTDDTKFSVAGTAVKQAIKMAIPKNIKEAIGRTDTRMGDYFQEILYRIGDLGDLFNPVGSIIGELFGAKRVKKEDISLSKFNRGAMPWNGLAQRTLIEVIPEYLSSMDANLASITNQMSISSKNRVDRRYYDNERGVFRTKTDIEKAFFAESGNSFQSAMMTPLNDLMGEIKNSAMSTREQYKLKQSLGRILQSRLVGEDSIQDSRKKMQTALGGLTDPQFAATVNAIEKAFDDFNNQMRELNQTISTSDSIYRTINNQQGKEAWRRIKDEKVDPFAFVFGSIGSSTPRDTIMDILIENNRDNIEVASDSALQKAVLAAKTTGATKTELRKIVLEYADNKALRTGITGAIQRIFKPKQPGKFAIGTENIINEIDSKVFGIAYGMHRKETTKKKRKNIRRTGDRGDIADSDSSDDIEPDLPPPTQPTPEQPKKVGAASSNATKRLGITTESDIKSGITITPNNSRSNNLDQLTENIIGTNISNLDTNSNQIEMNGKALATEIKSQLDEPPANNVVGAITQLTNATRTSTLGSVQAYLGMNDGLFGKDGLVSKIVSDEAVQESINNLKEDLIGEDHGKFKEEYAEAKDASKEIATKTKDYLLKGYDMVYDNTMKYILGDNYKESSIYNSLLGKIDRSNKRPSENVSVEDTITNMTESQKTLAEETITPVIQQSAEKIETAVDEFVAETFGDPEVPQEKKRSEFFSKFMNLAPKVLAGAVVGAGAVALSGGTMGILGSLFLPSSIIGGAITGFGLTILSQTEAFKSIMFGKMGEDGERQGGFISKEMSEGFKKALPFAIGGATLGVLKNIVFSGSASGGPLGVVTGTLLPGGPLGAAIIGLGIGILGQNTTIKEKLFGKESGDGKRSGSILSSGYNRVTDFIKNSSPVLKKGAKGAVVGALSGATLSSMGIIPAMFSLGGPVGAGFAGLALGLASSTKTFNEYIFGSEELDENGEPTGKRAKDGLLGRTRNLLRTTVIDPTITVFKNSFDDTRAWLKRNVLFPFRKAVGPIVDSFRDIGNNVKVSIDTTFHSISNGIIDVFRNIFSKITSPFTKIIRVAGKSVANFLSLGTKLTVAPVAGGLQILNLLTMGKRRRGYIDFYKDYFFGKGNEVRKQALEDKWAAEDADPNFQRGLFGKTKDRISSIINFDDPIKRAARAGYNRQIAKEGKDALRWREVPEDERDFNRSEISRKKSIKTWVKVDKYREKLANEWGGREFQLKSKAEANIIKDFKRLGVDVKDSDDIMDLVYRRSEWKKKKTDNGEGITIKESKEAKKSYENSDKMVEILQRIEAHFADIAFERLHPEWNTLTREEKMRNIRRLRKHAKKYGFDENEAFYRLEDEEINFGMDLDDTHWNEFRESEYYHSGDLASWIREKKKFAPITPVEEPNTQQKNHLDAIVNSIREVTESVRNNARISEKIADNTNASVVVATGGEYTAESASAAAELGGSVRRKLFGKFNITDTEAFYNIKAGMGSVFENIFHWKKKEDRAKAEATEHAEVTSGVTMRSDNKVEEELTDILNSEDSSEKSSGILGFAGNLLGGVFSKVGSSKIGRGVLNGLKAWGIAAGIIGVIDAFSPGFADRVVQKADGIGDAIGDTTETVIAPFVGKVFDSIGNTLIKTADGIITNGPSIYTKFIQPILTTMSRIVTEYGPQFISKSADVMISLIPSLTDAFIRVVPSLAKALTLGVYDATLGKFLGNKSSESVTEDDVYGEVFGEHGEVINRLTQDGRQIAVDPVTGELKVLGSTTVMDSRGKEVAIKNTGANQAILNISDHVIRDLLLNGSKSLGGTIYRGGSRLIGAGIGGLAGVAGSFLPGVNPVTGAVVGGRIGGTISKSIASGIGNLGEKITSNKIMAFLLGKAAQEGAEAGVEAATGQAIRAAYQGVRNGRNVLKVAGKVGAEEGIEAVTRTAASAAADSVTGSRLKSITKIIRKAVDSFRNNQIISKWFSKNASKIGTSGVSKVFTMISKYADEFIQALTKLGSKGTKWLAKIEAKLGLGGIKAIPWIQVAFTTWDMGTGLFEAANLFHVDESDVNWSMRLVSSLMKTLLGLNLGGALLDILLEIGGAIVGKDYKQEIATALYGIINSDDLENLKNNQERQELETMIYNSLNSTNLSTDAYNDMKNKTVFQKITGGIGAFFNPSARREQQEQQNAIKLAEQYANSAWASGVRVPNQATTNIHSTPQAPITTSNYDSSYEDSQYLMTNTFGHGLGYGTGYKQGDSRWKNLRIGTMPNGAPATMANGGCGPTALAIAASDLTGHSYSPAAIGRFAAQNGYISGGGANAGLFTAGASRIGIASKPMHSARETAANIASGRPVILSGRSGDSSKDPFTKAGHIVVAEGMDRSGNVRVKDPLDGRVKRYGLKNLLNRTTSGFALGHGNINYGNPNSAIDRILGYGLSLSNALTEDGYLALINGDAAEYEKLKGASNNGLSTARNIFNQMNAHQIIDFATMAMQHGGAFGSGRVAEKTGITRTMLLARLLEIAEKGTYRHIDPNAPRNTTDPYNEGWVTEDKRATARVLANMLRYDYYQNGNIESIRPLIRQMFLSNDGTTNYYQAYQEGLLPKDPKILELWAKVLLEEGHVGRTYHNPGVAPIKYLTDSLSQMAAIQYQLGNGAAGDQFNNLSRKLQSKYSGNIAQRKILDMVVETTLGASSPAMQNKMSTLMGNLIAELNSTDTSQYSKLNGYTWYDPFDSRWANLPYFTEDSEAPNQRLHEVLGMASILSTFTGKAFTPKLIAEKLLPYYAMKYRSGDTNAPFITGSVGNRAIIDFNKLISNPDARNSFFNEDFMRDSEGRSILANPMGFAQLEDIKKSLQGHYPFLFRSGMFDHSIFGGYSPITDMDKDENSIVGILQNYNAAKKMIQYISTGNSSPLYSWASALFDENAESQLKHGGLSLSYSDGTAPEFKTSSGQVGMLANGLESPENEESGPFALLTKLLKTISGGMEKLMESVLLPTKTSKDDIMQETVANIQSLGYGPGTDELKKNLTKMVMTPVQAKLKGLITDADLATNKNTEQTSSEFGAMSGLSNIFGGITEYMNNKIGAYLYGDSWSSMNGGSSTGYTFGTPSGVTLNPSESSNQIYRSLKEFGYNDIAAAGIMGCWAPESGNRADRLEGDYLSGFPGFHRAMMSNSSLDTYTTKFLFPAYARSNVGINKAAYKASDGHYYPGIGLAQWTGPRGLQLLSHAKSNGKDWRDLDGQLSFFQHEMTNRGDLIRKLNGAPNVTEATRIFMEQYEMTKGSSTKYPSKFATRVSSANQIMKTYGALGYGIGSDLLSGVVNNVTSKLTAKQKAKSMKDTSAKAKIIETAKTQSSVTPSSTDGYSQEYTDNPESINITGVGAENDFDILGRVMTAMIGSKMNGTHWMDEYDSLEGYTLPIFGSSGNLLSGAGASATAGAMGMQTIPFLPSLEGASENQAKVVNKMSSVYGKLRYSLAPGAQDPDKGSGSCASTVGWAFKKALGINGMSASSTAQSKDTRFTTVWTKNRGDQSLDISLLQPGDILYQNFNRGSAPNNGTMGHTEMYAGNGYTLSHGGGASGKEYGPIYKNMNDWRKDRTMMVRRYDGFIDMARATGYGNGMDDVDQAWNILGSDAGKDQIDTGFQSIKKDAAETAQQESYYGPGPATSINAVLKTGKMEDKLDAILGVISQWYDTDKTRDKSNPINVTNNNTTNMVANNPKTSISKKELTKAPPQHMDNSRLRALHKSIASIRR